MWDDLLNLAGARKRRIDAARVRRWRKKQGEKYLAYARMKRIPRAHLWRKGGKYYETRVKKPGYHERMRDWQREYRERLKSNHA